MNDYKRLSIEELRAFRGFENYTNEMAEETITSLELHHKAILEKERLSAY